MGLRGIFLFSIFCFIFGGIIGYDLNDEIKKLPGQPDVTFKQFSGYIDIDSKAGRSLFYYFVEAENDPNNRPLTIWLTGGPGCSSVSDSFVGVGPFITTNNARGLKRNPYAWTKVSNLLFIDTPIGSGWSYSNTSDDYQTGDKATTNDLLEFIRKWFKKYPSFKSKDLYLSGISYAGHFVPNLANALLQYNNQSKSSKFNLKGIALGSPVIRYKLDVLEEYELYASKGMFPEKLHQQILNQCNGIDENNYFNNATQWSKSCRQTMEKSLLIAFNVTSVTKASKKQFDVHRKSCEGKRKELDSGKEVTKIVDGVDMCSPLRSDFYFRIPEVQKAFRGNRTKLAYQYNGCFQNSGLNYSKFDKDNDMLPTYKKIIKQSVPITIFSGEDDGAIPTTGTLKHIQKLATDMNMKFIEKKIWNYENKEGGWMYSFGDLLTFMSIKGGNHHAPMSKPAETLFIFKDIVIKHDHQKSLDIMEF